MRLRNHFLFQFYFFLCVLFFTGGCDRGPSPEEKHADSTLEKAKEALDQGRHAESRKLLLTALALDQELDRDRQMAEETELLGNSYFAAADYDSALFYYNQATEYYRSSAAR